MPNHELKDALLSIPDWQDRLLMLLHIIYGLEKGELACLFGKSISTVYNVVERSTKYVKQHFSGQSANYTLTNDWRVRASLPYDL